MEITVAHNQQQNVASHKRKFVAGISQSIRVVIRYLPDLSVHAVFSAIDRIDRVEWSSNDSFVLATVTTQGVVHVWAVDDPDWSCRIDTGIAGLSDAKFHPTSSRHILVYSEFGLKLDVWDLLNQSRETLRDVKSNFAPVVSHSKRYALLLTRQYGRDQVLILDLRDTFRVVKKIPLHACSDIQHLFWTSNDAGIVACESALKPHLYHFDVNDGSLRTKLSLYNDEDSPQLGLRTVDATRHNIFVGCYDETVAVFSIADGLALLARVPFKDNFIRVIDDSPLVLKESLGGEASVRQRNLYQLGGGETHGFPVEYREVIPDESGVGELGHVQLPSLDSVFSRSHVEGKKVSYVGPPCGGVSTIRSSPDGSWVAIQSDRKSSIVFLLEVSKMKPTVIVIHRQPVRDFNWNPAGLGSRNQLSISTADSRVFIWTPAMDNQTVEMKESAFKPVQLEWTSDGTELILSEKDRFCSLLVNKRVSQSGG